ncbi:hypothetical protein BB560_006727 [Smittium megazygosporum]|uniref:Uncharacterized protein n=1 Tax=Smittium megazygosporum TaxID=133381 RepID=A0A2T9Y269_9FUNG|nr:hypothetical protein BB560_006727 [Smittium megazygosporum]
MDFELRVIKGITGGGFVGPKTQYSVDIKGNLNGATIEHTDYSGPEPQTSTKSIPPGYKFL